MLREEGVKKGDVVLIYMPMIPAALFAMLAIARLGAIHAVVFGGFSPAALAQRIEASRPVAIMTASCGIEGAKKPTEYKSMIEGAVHKSSFKPFKTIVWQREQLRWDPIVKEEGQRKRRRTVHHLHIRYYRATKGCCPLSRGSRCWTELFHQVPVRSPWSGRRYVHGKRYRLGCWAFLHCLRSTASWCYHCSIRGQTRRNPRCEHLLARHRRL